jgi:hypothetical protein
VEGSRHDSRPALVYLESETHRINGLSLDQSLAMSARLRANRDRNRRAEWARRIAADQRREAQRAAATVQSISRQIRSIQPGGRPRLYSVGPLQGAGVVTAILPNGRRSRMRIILCLLESPYFVGAVELASSDG